MHHHHHHPSSTTNNAFIIGASLNILYVIVEIIFGFLSNSLSLLADAGHNFGDVLILLLAWGANLLATVKPTDNHTYGYRRATILAALISSITLVFTMGFIAIEAIKRLNTMVEADSVTIITIASIGIVINILTASLFIKHKDKDLNAKGAFLNMFADVVISVAVVLGGIIIYFTNWQSIDPILSLFIILVIAISSWGLIRDSFNLSVDAVPSNIDIKAIRDFLVSLPDVTEVNDLHIWAMSTTQVALTAHIVRDSTDIDDDILRYATQELREHYGIHHTTIQIENGHSNLQNKNELFLDKHSGTK